MTVDRGLVRLIAEGGASIGMGHLARSTALAAAFGLRGYAVETLGVGLGAPIAIDGITWEPCADLASTDNDEVLLVADGYGLAGAFEDRAGPVVAMCERWDSGSVPVAYLDIGGGEAPGGISELRYACLRRPFWTCTRRRSVSAVECVLVTSGGSDTAHRVDALAAEIAGAVPGVEVLAIRGPFSEADAAKGVSLIDAPPDLLAPLVDADLVVTAGGQTMLESLATGAPTIALVLAADQRAQVDAVVAEGACDLAHPSGLREAVASLAADRQHRQTLAKRAQDVVDGLGAHRLATRFITASHLLPGGFAGVGGVNLRPAATSDADFLLALRNEQAVRAVSRNSGIVDPEDHRAWLDTAITSETRHLFVVDVAGEACGQVRLDLDCGRCEISVTLVGSARGRGIGVAAIRSGTLYALTELDRSAIEAWVGQKNTASGTAFHSAGFRTTGRSDEEGFAELRCTSADFFAPD